MVCAGLSRDKGYLLQECCPPPTLFWRFQGSRLQLRLLGPAHTLSQVVRSLPRPSVARAGLVPFASTPEWEKAETECYFAETAALILLQTGGLVR